MTDNFLELGDNHLESKSTAKFLKGSAGLGIFVNQIVQYSNSSIPEEHQAIKIISHEQAIELRDFLNEVYPTER